MSRIARVFPRRTRATPTDDLAFVGYPDMFAGDFDEIHISVAFTWDLFLAEKLAREWGRHGKVKLGGPAYSAQESGEFEPGMYLRVD